MRSRSAAPRSGFVQQADPVGLTGIVTHDGRTLEGFNQGESRREITLRFMGGGTLTVPIKDIATAGYVDGQSVVPNLTAALPPETVASIVAYLRSLQ